MVKILYWNIFLFWAELPDVAYNLVIGIPTAHLYVKSTHKIFQLRNPYPTHTKYSLCIIAIWRPVPLKTWSHLWIFHPCSYNVSNLPSLTACSDEDMVWSLGGSFLRPYPLLARLVTFSISNTQPYVSRYVDNTILKTLGYTGHMTLYHVRVIPIFHYYVWLRKQVESFAHLSRWATYLQRLLQPNLN